MQQRGYKKTNLVISFEWFFLHCQIPDTLTNNLFRYIIKIPLKVGFFIELYPDSLMSKMFLTVEQRQPILLLHTPHPLHSHRYHPHFVVVVRHQRRVVLPHPDWLYTIPRWRPSRHYLIR